MSCSRLTTARSGEHGLVNKGYPYEASARIPFVIAYPGKIKPGTVLHEALATVDFKPTILALLGLPRDEHDEGRDVSGLFLTGKAPADWKNMTFSRDAGGRWLMAVSSRYKFIVYPTTTRACSIWTRTRSRCTTCSPPRLARDGARVGAGLHGLRAAMPGTVHRRARHARRSSLGRRWRRSLHSAQTHRRRSRGWDCQRRVRQNCYQRETHSSLTLTLLAAQGALPAAAADASKPNIVFILADDLGYGDVKCNYPAGKIPTPNIDRLASEGMRFTDAHAPSAVCTPTRYSILTGRYCWRTRLKAGVLWQWEAPLIPAERLTLPGLLRTNGYRTAALGKWHLGLNWPFASDEGRG